MLPEMEQELKVAVEMSLIEREKKRIEVLNRDPEQ
jgi:hypothetical protein